MKNSEIKILLIDDEAPILRILASFLEDHDYQIFSATSGEMALSLEESNNCHIAIVDMRMDGIDGEQTMIKLRERNPYLKFIIHTGSSEYYINEPLKKLGIKEKYFFKKPVLNMNVFLNAIDNLLNEEDYE